jgi:BRCT domain type II-containing protein
MKQLLLSTAIFAALAIPVEVGAQTSPPAQSVNRMSTGGKATSERGAPASVSRAHHRHHTAKSARNTSAGDVANQLNRQELANIQSTNPTTMNRMESGGKPTSGGHQ